MDILTIVSLCSWKVNILHLKLNFSPVHIIQTGKLTGCITYKMDKNDQLNNFFYLSK